MSPRRAHILGLGLTGRAVANWLLDHGWMVIISDDAMNGDLQRAAAELKGRGAEVILGGHRGALTKPAQLVVLSPGISPDISTVVERKKQGAEVIGEVELAWRNVKGLVAGITGANGKSTTTALLGEIFLKSGKQTFIVGNIGTPFITIVDKTTSESLISLEVSSYQLETIHSFHPRIGVILNVTPDHLERHGTLEKYGAAKAKLWLNQTAEDTVVFNADDPVVVGLISSARSRKIPFSTSGPLTFGGWIEDGLFKFRLPDMPEIQFERSLSVLPGRHNEANILAASLAAFAAGMTPDIIRDGIASFKGLSHRLEFIRELDGVRYVNDSKATNPDAGRWALEAVHSPVILIAGGRPKRGGFRSVRPFVEGKVKRLLAIGEAATELIHDLGDLVVTEKLDDMAAAIRSARSHASAGDTVLLSPLCASFDQYKNFEERGEHFRKLVTDMK